MIIKTTQQAGDVVVNYITKRERICSSSCVINRRINRLVLRHFKTVNMVFIRWLFFVHVILLFKMEMTISGEGITRHSTKAQERDEETILENLARTRDNISQISKTEQLKRTLQSHHRLIRSLINTTATNNQTGDLNTNRTITVPKFLDRIFTLKPFTFRKVEVKPPTVQLKTFTPRPELTLSTFKLPEVFTAVPNCQVKAYSCSNQRTKQSYFAIYSSFQTNQGNSKKCNCDSACNDVFADCCSDFAKECLKHDINDKSDDVYLHHSDWRCENELNVSTEDCSKTRGLWMIARCPNDWLDGVTKRKCHNAAAKLSVQSYDSLVPVIGSSQKLTYRNQYCALCNNVSKFEFMTLIFKKEAVPPPYFTPEQLNKYITKNLHYFQGVRPNEGQKLRWCHYPNIISSCQTATSRSARDACANGTVGLVEGAGGKVFRNKDCALCNGEDYTCGVGLKPSHCVGDPNSIDRAISLRDYGVALETNSCPKNQVYDPYFGKCRETYEVTELKKNITDKYQVIVSVLKLKKNFFFNEWDLFNKKMAEYFKMNESQIIIGNVLERFSEFLVVFTLNLTPVQSLIVASDPEFSGNDSTGLRRIFKFKEAFELAIPGYDRFRIYQLRVRQLSCIHRQVYNKEEYNVLDDLRIRVNSTGAIYGQSEYYLITKNNTSTATVCLKLPLSKCDGYNIRLNSSEYKLFDNLTLTYGSLMYNFGNYSYEDGTVLICTQFKQNYTTSRKTAAKDELTLIVLTYVGFSLSIIGLLALLVTYTVFRELRTLPGKNLMSLCISLCLAETLWLCGSLATANETACTVIAIANHYFFLVFFAASSVIAFHSCLIFGKKISTPGNSSENSNTFLIYSLVAWATPAVFVLIFALLDHFGVFRSDYGKSDICWLATRDSKLFLFIVPFGVLLLFNLLLFSFVAFRLRKHQKSSAQSLGKMAKNRQARSVVISMKLSTLMGFSWLFGLIQVAFETETNVFAYFFVIFVSFQGLFICIAFLFKRTNYQLYNSLISKSFNNSGSRRSGPTPPQKTVSIDKNIYQDTKL